MVDKIDNVLGKLDLLIETQEFYEAVLNAMPYGMFTVNKKFVITHVNVPLCEYLGYSREELLGQPLTFIMPKEDRKMHQANEKKFSRNPQPRQGNHGLNPRVLKKNKQISQVDVSFTPFTLNGNGNVLVIIRDIKDIQQSLGIA